MVRDTTIAATQEATAVAEPFAQAMLSTKLMGTVTAVLVKEGDKVSAGQPLVRIDARDLDAKRQQVQAGIASAEAKYSQWPCLRSKRNSASGSFFSSWTSSSVYL